MTGKELYDMYAEASEMNGVSVDSWDDIDENDVQVWEDLADLVLEKLK